MSTLTPSAAAPAADANGRQLLQPAPAADHVSLRTWIAVVGAALGAFMAILNIQIVGSSLGDIQGAIGAGSDDGAWITTAYLVAEIVVIPVSAWLARVFSLRSYLITNAILFTLLTCACAFAHNLGQMIVLRALQGAAGGVLIPLAFTIILTTLPPSKHPIGIAIYSLSAVFAPSVGPVLGGYFSETFGWQSMFFISLPPGLVMIAMLWFSLDRSPRQFHLLRQGDWIGVFTMVIGLGALETVLEEGNKNDWFASPFIVRLALISAVCLLAFVYVQLKRKQPLLHLKLLARRNFGLGSVVNFLFGISIYGWIFTVPAYLGQVQGYSAKQIGEVMIWLGLPQLLFIPLLPKVMRYIDARVMAAAGFALFAIGTWTASEMSGDFSGPQFLASNLMRALAQVMVMTPLSAIAIAGIEREFAGSASALFNMMRNLGGAIGIALLQTILTKREQFHSYVNTENLSILGEATRQRLQGLTEYFMAHGVADPALAHHKAVVAVGRAIRHQAFLQGYGDIVIVQSLALAVALIMVLFLRKPSPGPVVDSH
jgi:DHA2 family multidrug resistance protein